MEEKDIEKIVRIPDVYKSIVNKVDTIEDLINVCNLSTITRYYCFKYNREYFFDLIKKPIFRNSYYNLVYRVLKNEPNKFEYILKYYPIGKYYANNDINDMQKMIIRDKLYMKLDWDNIIELLFFPLTQLTNKDDLLDISEIDLRKLGFLRSKYIPRILDVSDFIVDLIKLTGKPYNVICDLIIYRLEELKVFNKELFDILVEIYLKQIIYFVYTTDEDDIFDFVEFYSEHIMYFLNKLYELDKENIKSIIKNLLINLNGINLEDYEDNRNNENYPYLLKVFEILNKK